jgi:hypothetical protein
VSARLHQNQTRHQLLIEVMKRLLLFFCFAHLNAGTGFAQTGSWNIANLKINLNNKWSLFAEAQIRSLRFYDDFHYYEFKGGASLKLDKGFTLSAGLGNFDTYREGDNFKTPMQNDEFRTWVQLSMSQNVLQRLKFEHRYRAEQRFTLNGYRNRFRYRLNTVYPLSKKGMEKKSGYLTAANEIFFTNRAPYFERNRLFAGAGYILSDAFTLQAGYMNQFDYRINDETGRNFLQISLLFELDWKKKTPHALPGSMN